MKTAVVVFPGSNCDRDIAVALETISGRAPQMLWHADATLPDGLDLVVVPGGFSFGDYLRSGAISAHSPIMRAVKAAGEAGVRVLGVCNGFQILTEAGMLPGALLRNAGLDYVCRDVALTVATTDSPFTRAYAADERIRVPVAHNDGNYTADAETLDRLEGEGLIAFRYADPLNGSARAIAGVLGGPNRNVLGMMPHPERAIEPAHGGTDGRRLFESLIAA